MAKRIPGKEEFYETLRYFNRQIELTGVQLHLNTRATPEMLAGQGFQEVILATGVNPRKAGIEGENHPKALSYIDVLLRKKPVGKFVAIIGAGGIGFDVAEYLAHPEPHSDAPLQSFNPSTLQSFTQEWGVDMDYENRGAVAKPAPEPPAREIWLLKRSKGKHGANLGKTTGWIHRSSLKMKKVKMLAEVQYQKIDDEGLHILHEGKTKVLPVDNVIICAGQNPMREMFEPLQAKGIPVHLIGGASVAAELDAKRAIKEGAELAARL